MFPLSAAPGVDCRRPGFPGGGVRKIDLQVVTGASLSFSDDTWLDLDRFNLGGDVDYVA